tara:strand:- start:4719 stop:7805 length:3087 start_codon:yes stop_codon:yes gene_type:complete
MICNGNDPKQQAFVKEIIENGLDRLINDPKAQMIGATDRMTFEWLWNKYTGSPWGTREIHKTDIKRFNRGLSIFLNGIGKKQNWIQRNFYLPKRLTGTTFFGEKFIQGVGEAASYHQRLMKEGKKLTDDMIGGLYEMFIDKQSPLYQKWGRDLTKKELKEFQELERELWLNPKSVDPVKHDALMTRLSQMAGWNMSEGTTGVSYAGEVLKRYQGILDFTIVTGLTPTEKIILNKWNVLRADMMKALINTGITQKRIAQELNNPVERDFIVRSIERIQKEIDALLIQGNIDMKQIKNDPEKAGWEQSWENGLEVVDPRTGVIEKYKVEDPHTGEMVLATGIKKYFPKLVLEMTDIMNNITKFANDKDRVQYDNLTPEQLEQTIIADLQPGNVAKRLKQAADDSKYWSLDPVHYLTKYVHDVASSNFKARVQYAYIDGIKSLVEATRKINTGGWKGSEESKEIGSYANEMINTMAQIRDSAINNYKGSLTEVDHAIRLINGFEYMSKLGFSLKSGLKNRTQGFWNWIEFGSMGYYRSRKFYEGTDRPYDPTRGEKEVTNSMMVERQLRRMGMMMGEKGSTVGDAASISSATAGSLDVIMVPKGFTVNAEGALVHASKKSNLARAADNMSWLADLSSKYTTGTVLTFGMLGQRYSQQWAENQNRLKTFKMAFAHAFTLEQKRHSYWVDKLTKAKKKQPTDTEVYDAMENAAGNIALEMVKKLHFDYDNWAKAKILQGRGGKTIGQFQHFKFAFFDLNYQLVRNVARDVKDFNIVEINPYTGKKRINSNFQQLSRMSMVYSMLGGLAAYLFDIEVGGLFSTIGYQPGTREDEGRFISGSKGGLIDNPIIEEANKLIDFMGADRESGTPAEEEKLYGSYFGKGPIISNMGPFVSDLFTVAELFDFLNLTSDQYAKRKHLNYEPSNWQWRYQVARIFNVAAARTIWHTIPALARGDIPQAIRIETGLYKPRWISKWAAESKRDIAEKIGYSKKGWTGRDPFVKQKKYEARKAKNKAKVNEDEQKRKVLQSLNQF